METVTAGWLLLSASFLYFSVMIYAIVLSKILPPSQAWLRLVAEDRYYCLLAVASLPAGFVLATVNWFGMKCFRHN